MIENLNIYFDMASMILWTAYYILKIQLYIYIKKKSDMMHI